MAKQSVEVGDTREGKRWRRRTSGARALNAERSRMTTRPDKSYADIVRGALQNPRDRKSMREVGRKIGYSYEHIRKVLAGELTFTKEFSDALCRELGLDAPQMWALAQTLKLRKKFEGARLPVDLPRDVRIKEIWAALTETQRDAWIKVGQGWAQANAFMKVGDQMSGPGSRRIHNP
jgi:hypothetical protein